MEQLYWLIFSIAVICGGGDCTAEVRALLGQNLPVVRTITYLTGRPSQTCSSEISLLSRILPFPLPVTSACRLQMFG